MVVGVAGVVVLAITVAGVVAVRHYLDKASSLSERMSLKYHAQYRACVENGGDRTRCAAGAEAACATDTAWAGDSRRLDDIAQSCRFGVAGPG